MSVYSASREPDFKSDLNTYGKIGERFFLACFGNSMTAKGWIIYDVSNEPFWQKLDIDFVVSKAGKPLINDMSTVLDESFLKIEVKVDTRCHKTGNLPYEIISHGKWGWSISTCADRAIVVSCEDGLKDGKLYAYEFYMIDMVKWKVFSSYSINCAKDVPNKIEKEEIYDFLCRIEDMKRSGVITNTVAVNSWI